MEQHPGNRKERKNVEQTKKQDHKIYQTVAKNRLSIRASTKIVQPKICYFENISFATCYNFGIFCLIRS